MNSDWYRFTVGTFACFAVSVGTHVYTDPAPLLFANAPATQLEQALLTNNIQPAQWGEWTNTYTCLLIVTGTHHVLVDTGAGSLAPTAGRLLQNLRAVAGQRTSRQDRSRTQVRLAGRAVARARSTRSA
jgi:hypothetical protein